MRQVQCVPTTYVTEIKETYLSRIVAISLASLNYLKLPMSIKIPGTIWQIALYLHDSYITKFDFMNYAFAKLVLAWL